MRAELRNTIILAACAVILSFASAISLKMGKGELFPSGRIK